MFYPWSRGFPTIKFKWKYWNLKSPLWPPLTAIVSFHHLNILLIHSGSSKRTFHIVQQIWKLKVKIERFKSIHTIFIVSGFKILPQNLTMYTFMTQKINFKLLINKKKVRYYLLHHWKRNSNNKLFTKPIRTYGLQIRALQKSQISIVYIMQ